MATDTTARIFRILGTSDEVTSCDCCGKVGLKSTVALVELDADGSESEPLYFGCTCAARAMRREVKEVRREVADADRAEVARKNAERMARMDAENNRWFAFLIERTGGIFDRHGRPEVFEMIQRLGGFKAAREGYAA